MPAELETLLRNYPPDVKATALALRRLVKKTAPHAAEVVRPGWKAIMYGTNESMKSMFCVIHPERAWVNLGFSRGTELKDPYNLLEGTGNRIRHVKVKSVKDMKTPALRALVLQAARLAPRPK